MLAAVFLILIFFLLLISCRNRRTINGFPVFPGTLPILGNAHILLGDNVHLFNILKRFGETALENDGYVVLLLGPFKRMYVISDPDDCSTALNACLDKHYVYSFAKAWIGSGILTTDVQTWKRNRKFFHPMFNLQNLWRFLPIFNKQARRLVDSLQKQEGKGPFNPEIQVLLVSLETVCQTAFGTDVADYLATSKNKDYVGAINGMLDIIVSRFKQVWLHSDFIFNWSSLKKKQDNVLKVIYNMSEELIKKRRSVLNAEVIDKGDDIRPFIDTILKVALENEGFTEEKIHQEVNTIIMAAYDTTANAIIFCMLLLGHHQDVQEKLYAELQEVFGDSDRDIVKDDFVKLVYLEAVVKETLRLYPVIPTVARKTNVEIKLKKHTLPAGSEFFIASYTLNRHPLWGPDVKQFRPERWLDGTAPDNPNLFATFGLGKRYCIGKTYNFLSFKTTMSHLIRKFHVTADISNLVLKMEILLKPASGHEISLRLRK